MSVYLKQRQYFEEAYQTGEHGWPTTEATPFVVRSIKRLLQNGSLDRGSHVLDLGCGEGRHTFSCAELGLKAIGLDYQPLAIVRARSMPKAKRLQKKCRFIVGDIFHLPFEREVFDLIIDCGCFHHVRKSDTMVYRSNIISMLVPGGYFILSCFSWRFRHHPRERRKRDWLVHRGHYDRFFRKSDFSKIFGMRFNILEVKEEREGLYAFYQVLMRNKNEG